MLSILKKSPETAAMVRTTYAITELAGSPAANIIPKRARATVNVRIDPAENVEVALDRIRARFGSDATVEPLFAFDPSPVSAFDDDAFGYLRRIVHSVYPDAGIAPYVQSSCSDARHLHRICPRTYRFAGILFRGDQRTRIHGQDENLDVESYKKGVGFYVEFIEHLGELRR